jgi:deazaflavin-dependent oxidoreductase (nitroreductase family)
MRHDAAVTETKVTFSGRAVHFMMSHFFGLAKSSSRRQAEAYAKSGGRKGAAISGKPTFRLVVKGRSSGEPRPVMLMLIRRGEELLVCGSQGGRPEHPNWWLNLVAAGQAEAQIGDQTFPVDFREVTDPAERDEVWRLLVAGYPDFGSYQALTDRVLPVGVLTPRQ